MNQSLKDKLNEILDFEIKESFTNHSIEDVAAIENEFNIKLPDDYIFYLLNYGNDYINENYRLKLKKDIPEKILEIDSIYGFNNDENSLIKKLYFYKNILPAGFLPIADISGGDLICIKTSEPDRYNIFLWKHESNSEEPIHLALSFSEFIFSFSRITVQPRDTSKISIHLSPELDAIFKSASKKKG